jgi:hypothetical protein
MDPTNELERLQRELEETRRQLEVMKEDRKQQEERVRKQEERARKQEERALKAENNMSGQLSDTTLSQYLTSCHRFLFQALKVQLDSSMSAGGGVTDATGRFYPLFIRPWDDFTQTQRHHFGIIRDALGDEKLFLPEIGIRAIQSRACGSPVANEDDIKPFEQLAVEAPVRDIMNALGAKASAHQALQPFNFSRISFVNHSYGISEEYGEAGSGDVGEDGQNQLRQRRSPTKRPAYERRRMYPDRRCIRKDLSGARTTAFVIEYKAAHKVRAGDLRQSLSVGDLVAEVIKRALSTKSNVEANENRRDKRDRLVAMILTQTFDYMIGFGLEYSYLAAGKSLIFLRVKEDDPRTLYYALVTPGEEEDDEDEAVTEFETAVAQVASFCLLALRSTTYTEAWVTAAQKLLCQWPIPYPEMGYEATEDEGSTEEASHTSQSSEQSFDRILTASVPLRNINLRSRSTCNPEVIRDNRQYSSDSDNNDDHVPQHPPGATGSSQTRSKRKEAPSSGDGSRSSSGLSSEIETQARLYCTQACLLGLKRGWDLDEACPNVSLHRTVTSDGRHPINVDELACLIREQLARYRDRDCEPLEKYGKHGARGTLFKLTLAPYGYTFVGKGTMSENVRHLLREGKMYGRLERLQGEVVPVFLGNIDLVEPYHLTAMHSYYFTGARIVHMLLMSWVGERATQMSVPDLETEVARSSQVVRREGIVHNDEREANLLWSEECRRVMLIDFDHAELLPPVKNKRVGMLSRKRKGRKDDSEIPRDKRAVPYSGLDH